MLNDSKKVDIKRKSRCGLKAILAIGTETYETNLKLYMCSVQLLFSGIQEQFTYRNKSCSFN